MKKHLYFLAAGIMTLSACTSEEVVDVSATSGNAIGFQNVVGKATRADEAVEGDLDNTTFDNFLVYGYYTKKNTTTPIQIFNGVSVHKVTANNETKWTYDGIRYWIPDCTYQFYAYSCADVAFGEGKGNPIFDLTASENNRTLLLSQYICDATHQHDLVTAKNTAIGQEEGNADVSLKFSHALCKAQAVFTTDFPSEYKVYVSNVYISSFYNQADFNVRTDSWGNWQTKKDSDPSVTLSIPANSFVVNATGSKVSTAEAFLIPKKYEDTESVRIHFSIDIKKEITNASGTTVEESILQRNITGTWSPNWKAGMIYKYDIKISGSLAGIEPIVFAASQELDGTTSSDWDTATEIKMAFGVDAASTANE